MVPPPPKEEPWALSQEAWVWILALQTMRHVTSGLGFGASAPAPAGVVLEGASSVLRARSAQRMHLGSSCLLLIFLFTEGK